MEIGPNSAAALAPGTHVGPYEVVELLAMGGMAEIYIVESSGIQGARKRSVLKRLPPATMMNNLGYLNMFITEAKLVASLPHPNIVQVFDIGEDDDSYYFVMEHLDGLNLRELIRKCRKSNARVPMEIAIQIVLAVAEGLHAAHEARGTEGQPLAIVHRDISPNNIVVTGEGKVKLIDFGIAKSRATRAQTEAGVVKGKVAYMSPEQCRALPLDRRTDLYALGVILFELITGARPHRSRHGSELVEQIVGKDCEDPRMRTSHCPDELANIINKLLRRKMDDRYQTARELHEDLSAFAAREQMMLSTYQLASWVQETTGGRSAARSSSRAETRSLAMGTGADGVEASDLAAETQISAASSHLRSEAKNSPARWGATIAMFVCCSGLISAGMAIAYRLAG